jgi:hypothetical protein
MKRFFVSSLIVLVLFAALPVYASPRKDVLEQSQVEFLDKLMRDTFSFMHESVDPVTGLRSAHSQSGDRQRIGTNR